MMDSLQKARLNRMDAHAVQFRNKVDPEDLMPFLKCLPRLQKEKIGRKQTMDGAMAAALALHMAVVKVDNWFQELIPALRALNLNELANLLDDPPQDDRLKSHRDMDPQNRPKEKGKVLPQRRKHPSEACPSTSPRPSRSSGQSSEVTLQTPYRQLSATTLNVLRRLDVLSPATGSDWKGLAGQLGCSIDYVDKVRSQQQGSPTEAMLCDWGVETGATLEKLIEALRAIQRDDICQELGELLGLRLDLGGDQNDSAARPKPAASVCSHPQQDRQSEPAAKLHASAPIQPAVGTGVEEATGTEGPASGLPSDVELLQVGDSNEGAGTDMESDSAREKSDSARKESDSSPKPQKSQGFEVSKAVTPTPKETEVEEAESQSSVVGRKRSQSPVNNLNRDHPDSDLDASGGAEFHANCQGKSLPSNSPETCSDNSPGDGDGSWYVESNVLDCYHSLHADDSFDAMVSLRMSEASAPTIVQGASLDSSTSAGCDSKSSSLETSTISSPAASGTSGQAVAKVTSDGIAATAEVLTTAQGAPIRQPSGPSEFFPDQFQMPSTDAAFREDDLMRATVQSPSSPKVSSITQQFSEPVHQQLCDAKPLSDKVGPKALHPWPNPNKHSQDPAPNISRLKQEWVGELQQKQASSAVDDQNQHQALTNSPSTRLDSQEEGGSFKQSGSKKQEALSETPHISSPTSQLKLLNTTETTSPLQASPEEEKQVEVIDSLQESGTKTPEATPAALQQKASLPVRDNNQPAIHTPTDNNEDRGGESKELAEDENAGETTESRGRRALVGLALAVPVVLSLAAALKGGDILSDAFSSWQ